MPLLDFDTDFGSTTAAPADAPLQSPVSAPPVAQPQAAPQAPPAQQPVPWQANPAAEGPESAYPPPEAGPEAYDQLPPTPVQVDPREWYKRKRAAEDRARGITTDISHLDKEGPDLFRDRYQHYLENETSFSAARHNIGRIPYANLAFAATDLPRLHKAVKKIEDGTAERGDWDFAAQYLAHQQRESNASFLHRVSQAPGFLFELYGAGAIGNVLTRGGIKATEEGIARLATKYLAGRIGTTAAEALGRAGAGAAGMAGATPFMPSTYEAMGQATVRPDAQGLPQTVPLPRAVLEGGVKSLVTNAALGSAGLTRLDRAGGLTRWLAGTGGLVAAGEGAKEVLYGLGMAGDHAGVVRLLDSARKGELNKDAAKEVLNEFKLYGTLEAFMQGASALKRVADAGAEGRRYGKNADQAARDAAQQEWWKAYRPPPTQEAEVVPPTAGLLGGPRPEATPEAPAAPPPAPGPQPGPEPTSPAAAPQGQRGAPPEPRWPPAPFGEEEAGATGPAPLRGQPEPPPAAPPTPIMPARPGMPAAYPGERPSKAPAAAEGGWSAEVRADYEQQVRGLEAQGRQGEKGALLDWFTKKYGAPEAPATEPVSKPADAVQAKRGGVGGYHFHKAQEQVPGLAPGWIKGEDAHWQTYPEAQAQATDAQLGEAAAREPLPLPEHPDEARALVEPAWNLVSRLWPEAAARVKRVKVMDFKGQNVRAAMLKNGTLVIPADRGPMRPQDLWHELVHTQQQAEGRLPPQKDRTDAQHLELEREAYSRQAQMEQAGVWGRLEAMTRQRPAQGPEPGIDRPPPEAPAAPERTEAPAPKIGRKASAALRRGAGQGAAKPPPMAPLPPRTPEAPPQAPPPDPLEPRERQVVDMRKQGMSFRAVGKKMGLSGERVRQIEADAQKKLGAAGSIEQTEHAPRRAEARLAAAERGENVLPSDLTHGDLAEGGRVAGERDQYLNRRQKEFDDLVDAYAKEQQGGKLNAEREAYYRGEFTRLDREIAGGFAGAEDAGQGPPRPTGGGNEAAGNEAAAPQPLDPRAVREHAQRLAREDRADVERHNKLLAQARATMARLRGMKQFNASSLGEDYSQTPRFDLLVQEYGEAMFPGKQWHEQEQLLFDAIKGGPRKAKTAADFRSTAENQLRQAKQGEAGSFDFGANTGEIPEGMEAAGARYDPPAPRLTQLAKDYWDEITRLGAVPPGAARLASFTQNLGDTARAVKDEFDKLAGRQFPATTRHSRASGEALGRMISGPLYAHLRTPALIDKVLGEKPSGFGNWLKSWLPAARGAADTADLEAKTLGAVFVEDRLRQIKTANLEEARRRRDEAADAGARAQAATDPDAKAALEAAQKAAMRDARAAQKTADGVKSVIGGDGSLLRTEADYQHVRQSPRFAEVDRAWRQHMTPEMEANFRGAQGMEDSDPINSPTQVPGRPVNLKAITKPEDATATTAGTVGPRGERGGDLARLRAGRFKFAEQAAGNADFYETDLRKIIEHSIDHGTRIARKAEAMRQLVADGLAKWGTLGERPEFEGGTGKVLYDVKPPRGTQEAQAGQDQLYLDPRVYDEVRQAWGIDPKHDIPVLTPLLNLATKGALTSTAEAVYHAKNNLTMMFQPRMNPLGWVKHAWNKTWGDPATRDRIVELARIDAMKEHGQQTPILGPQSGYNPLVWMGKFLDVVDTATRLTADDAFDSMVKSGLVPDTETNRRDFISQTGQYNRKSQAKIVAWLRDSGVGPFATAGTNYVVQGWKTLVGGHGARTTGLKADLQLRAEKIARMAGLLGLAAVANYIAWKRPDGDDNTPLGAMKIGDADNGKTMYVDLGNFTGLPRGLRDAGLLAQAEGWRTGRPAAQSIDRGREQALLGHAHPAMGPGPQFLWTAATGKDTAGYHVAGKPGPGDTETWKNIQAAFSHANPLFAAASAADQPEAKRAQTPWWERAWKLAGPFGVQFRSRPPGAAASRGAQAARPATAPRAPRSKIGRKPGR